MCISRTNRDLDESASVHRTLGCLQDFDGGGLQKSGIAIMVKPRSRRCLIWTRQPDLQLEGKLKSEPSSICCLTNLDLNPLLTHMLETCLLRELKKVFIV
ncbi:hypothetical protein D8674_012074 [Pyrus ussuriensis x Pyrus communis]|uniref:Uncharacterized protein n=1 Tax=Pyrus ussuriensis x Pyrus communis TaxID=2448454 RepID=A0A5N5G0K5_9ROSA|nr:hypothetical protein D8674_012074 [Pyrus ussuriensis x Pyrus communis]